MKINCDGGFNAADRTGLAGVMLRNSSGSFLGAAARWFPGVSSVLAVEAEACRDGLRLAMMRGFRKVILETDSLELVS